MKSFFYYLKNIFILLFFLQLAPPMLKALKKQYYELLKDKTKIGKLKISGAITDSEPHVENLKKLIEEKEVKAVLLKIESPGGSAGPSYALYNEILKLKEKHPDIPIVMLTEGICASGGYYIACAADYLIASRTALVGSIGAYIAFPELNRFIEQLKVDYKIVKSGKYKAAGNPFKDLTEEEQAYFQELTNNIHKQFTKDVLERRPKITTDITQIAQGQVFTGNQALDLGLIDEVGSLEAAIKIIRKKASFENEIDWVTISKASNLWDMVTGNTNTSSKSIFSSFLSEIAKTISYSIWKTEASL